MSSFRCSNCIPVRRGGNIPPDILTGRCTIVQVSDSSDGLREAMVRQDVPAFHGDCKESGECICSEVLDLSFFKVSCFSFHFLRFSLASDHFGQNSISHGRAIVSKTKLNGISIIGRGRSKIFHHPSECFFFSTPGIGALIQSITLSQSIATPP